MSIFHIYLRPSSPGETQSFEVSDDYKSTSVEKVLINTEQIVHISGTPRTLSSLIQQLHDRKTERILTLDAQARIAAVIGETLFSFIIGTPKAISASFGNYCKTRGSKEFRIALHLPDVLHRLPWELLRDPNTESFIALTGSLIRYDVNVQQKDFEPVELPFKLWFVFANPSDRPFAQGVDYAPPALPKIYFDPISPPTFDEFRATIWGASKRTKKIRAMRPLILAFFGHGELGIVDAKRTGQLVFVKKQQREGSIADWTSDPRPSYTIKDIIATSPQLRVLFLCACESAWAGTAEDFDSSIAGTLLRGAASVGYVIGAQTPIDRFAADVFLSWILRLLPEQPLDLAISKARVAVRGMESSARQQYSRLDWWVPVLYARASGFDVVERADTRSMLIPPPPVPQPATIGLNLTSGEPISISAIVAETLRQFFGALSGSGSDSKAISNVEQPQSE